VITSWWTKQIEKLTKWLAKAHPKPIQNLTKQNQNETQKTEKTNQNSNQNHHQNSTNNKKKKIQLGWIFWLTLWITRIYYFTPKDCWGSKWICSFYFSLLLFLFFPFHHTFSKDFLLFYFFFSLQKKNDGKLQEYQGLNCSRFRLQDLLGF